jgi:hypothetical protein
MRAHSVLLKLLSCGARYKKIYPFQYTNESICPVTIIPTKHKLSNYLTQKYLFNFNAVRPTVTKNHLLNCFGVAHDLEVVLTP